jgi:hypothetical protein
MKTSWNNPRAIERFLSGALSTGESLLFRARLLTDPDLRITVAQQKKAYALVQQYGRQQMKTRLEAIHQSLFRDPEKKGYQQEVLQYFTKH